MKYLLRLLLLAIATTLLVIVGCRQTPSAPQRRLAAYPERLDGEPEIRVLALSRAGSVDLIVNGPYDLSAIETDGIKRKGGNDKPVTISVSAVPAGIKLGKYIYTSAKVTPLSGTPQLKIRYSSGSRLVVKSLPGSFTFKKDSKTGSCR